MQTEGYTDVSISWTAFLLKLCGVWLAENSVEKRKRKFFIAYTGFMLVYGVYLNAVDTYHRWGDLSHCIFLINNTLCISLAIFKLSMMTVRRTEFIYITTYAQRNFWHLNYNHDEKVHFTQCVKFCKLWVVAMYVMTQGVLIGYVIVPLSANVGRNRSDRVLPFKMWVDLPLSVTPYYELMFILQVICIYHIGASYLSAECFVCLLNMHAICQFRILQQRLLNLWPSIDKQSNPIEYVNKYYTAMKKCIRDHQSLLEFCDKLNTVYTLPILGNMMVFSMMMCFDTYEVFLADVSTWTRNIFLFHMIGTFIHIYFLTYSCHGLLDESMNVCTATYSSVWTNLPMNKVGQILRRHVILMMMRSQRPCCLTAGGFFPVSLETSTAIMSSTMSYFALMRQSSADDNGN
ncbi:unnamed protein product [Xylocopa violacea]|uniref:Odorant receptor n=1 Tax=Xylocopa violacea TaxID=135666 RepID=A0ABP1NBX6_XYLVO